MPPRAKRSGARPFRLTCILFVSPRFAAVPRRSPVLPDACTWSLSLPFCLFASLSAARRRAVLGQRTSFNALPVHLLRQVPFFLFLETFLSIGKTMRKSMQKTWKIAPKLSQHGTKMEPKIIKSRVPGPPWKKDEKRYGKSPKFY